MAFMDAKKNVKLLYLEVPVHSPKSLTKRTSEIFVSEGDPEDHRLSDSCSFPDSGGGQEIPVLNTSITRTLYWRTHANVLDLFEYSFHGDLHHNHYEIIFQNSKLLPGVRVFYNGGQVVVLFATLHAAHRLTLAAPHLRNKDRSMLQGLSSSNFEDANSNFYFAQPEHFSTMSAAITGNNATKQHTGAIFTLVNSSGNISIVKMPNKGQATMLQMNRASRMSRLWSGINPWAGSGSEETPSGLSLVCMNSGNPKVIGICQDHKLRVWSCKTSDCVSQFDLKPYLSDDQPSPDGSGSHKICVTYNEAYEDWTISVYFGFDPTPRFFIFKGNQDVSELEHISTIHFNPDAAAVQSRLIDFRVNADNHLWALLLDTDDQMSLSVYEMDRAIWHEVALSSPPLSDVAVPAHLTVREAYLKQLFHMNKFTPAAILKALAIHQKAAVSTRNMSIKLLKEKVISYVEQEVNMLLPDEGINAELLADAQVNAWQKFYSSCVQYDRFLSKPSGLLVTADGNVSVIKKNHVSHLVPVSSLEAVCRGADPGIFQSILPDEVNFDDLSKLLSSLDLLSCLLGPEYFESLVQSLESSSNPVEAVCENLSYVKELTSESYDYQDGVDRIGDVASATHMLITCLQPSALDYEFEVENCTMLGSEGSLEILSRAVQRYVGDRLHLSLLLLVFAVLEDEQQNMSPARISVFVQAYTAIWWAVTERAEHVSQSSLESTMQTLTMHDATGDSEAPTSGLLEYFLSTDGGRLVESIVRSSYQDFDETAGFNPMLVAHATAAVVQLLWPLGPTLSFPEFLLSKGQFSRLHRYIERELNSWCDFCPVYNLYLLAHCYLHTGQYEKAVEFFIQAGGKASKEEVLINRVLQVEDKTLHTPSQLEVLYYTKVLQIFEGLGLSEPCVILAKHAIGKAAGGDSNLPILCSSVFSHCLELRRHDDAYAAIVTNPDPEHRKDCLRAMVVALCERREYKTLVEYPYGDMLDDLVNILEHRARSCDLYSTKHKYYDLLFSFHVNRRNYRKAASTMYEQAWRLSVDSSAANSVTSLKQQHVCLVATVTCLQLVNSDYRWIVHPVTVQARHEELVKSPKRNSDGEILEPMRGRKVVIKELVDIQKETLLVEMKIKIANQSKNKSAIGPAMSAAETLSLLNHNAHYDHAFQLCAKFKLSNIPVFESLATRCVKASYSNDESQIMKWINKNARATALDHGHSSVSDMAWRLMRDYLECHVTPDDASSRHRAVLKIILGYGFTIPAWFLSAYKKLNCPELLRMLISYDYLEEATNISLDYIDAVLGVVPDQFAIKNTLLSTGGQVWLPYNEFEQLLEILDEMRLQEKYEALHGSLSDKLENYFQEAERISEAMLYARMAS